MYMKNTENDGDISGILSNSKVSQHVGKLRYSVICRVSSSKIGANSTGLTEAESTLLFGRVINQCD